MPADKTLRDHPVYFENNKSKCRLLCERFAYFTPPNKNYGQGKDKQYSSMRHDISIMIIPLDLHFYLGRYLMQMQLVIYWYDLP